MGKVHSLQEQMGGVSREREILRKNQRERLEIKNIATEMNNSFDKLIRRLGMTEERISELKNMSIELPKCKSKEKKRPKKNGADYPRSVG